MNHSCDSPTKEHALFIDFDAAPEKNNLLKGTKWHKDLKNSTKIRNKTVM